MYSVEMAGRTKMKSLLKYERCRILQHTELKNVSAHSGWRCVVEKADVMQLDLLPHFAVDFFRVVFVFEQFDAFVDALVV